MQLEFYHQTNGEGGVSEGVSNLKLSPCHPVLRLDPQDAAALLDRRMSEVLHVEVTRELKPGVVQKAHLHFSIGLNDRDQLVGEVTAMRNDHSSSCSRVASWREPVKTDAAPNCYQWGVG